MPIPRCARTCVAAIPNTPGRTTHSPPRPSKERKDALLADPPGHQVVRHRFEVDIAHGYARLIGPLQFTCGHFFKVDALNGCRSEERRVGRERRSRGYAARSSQTD